MGWAPPRPNCSLKKGPRWLSPTCVRRTAASWKRRLQRPVVRLFSLHWTFPKEDQWQSAVTQIVAQFGKLDILVNNAGISGSGERDHTSTEAWDRLMDINAKGVFLGMNTLSRRCGRREEARSSTSRPFPGLWAKNPSIQVTTLPKAQFGWLPRPLRSSTPRKH